MKKLKRIFCAIFALLLVGANVSGGIVPVLADEDDDYDYAQMHPAAYHVPDGDDDETNDLVLYKTAESVSGWANKWTVTLRIEAPVVTATSDTVLVIDRSNSMNGTPLTNAKDAAEVLVNKLLYTEGGREVNRVAVISYGSDVTTETGFSNVYNTVYGAVDDIEIDGPNGGTFTQAAMHQAAALLNSSTATYKNIVLLSDGEPTYSYRLNNPEDYLVSYSGGGANAVETNTSAPQTEYNYDRTAGNGTSLRTRFNTGCPRNENCYYNHGNSAIAEAGFFKNKGHLYTIAFVNSEIGTGTTILRDMATAAGGEAHSATADELDNVFNAIAGKIMDQVNSAHVHDVMGEGVVVEDVQHSTEIDWTNIVFKYDTTLGKYVATYSYEVEAGEHILDKNSTDGYHPLNEEATLVYTDANGVEQEADFPVPRVKPFFINVKKELVGQTCTANQCIFTFKIEHPAGEKTTEYTVEAGKTHRIVEAFPIGNYTLTEIGTNAGNPVAFENYTVEYAGNTFEITENHGDHIDVTIKNTYETVNLDASKVWQDEDDRDGLRGNYTNLYVVVRDGNNYVAHQKVTGATNQSFAFTGLPKNKNGAAIQYTLGEAICTGEEPSLSCSNFNDSNYTSTVGQDNVITNAHTPAKTRLTIKKIWDTSAGTLPSVTPGFVTVEVSNNRNNTVKTVTLRGDDYAEWTGVFEDYKYENGQEISYYIKEKTIGDSLLNSNNTLYVYDDNNVLEGKWVATKSGEEITNTWTPAETVYTGAGEFYIEKTDQDGEPLSGVTFTVDGEDYTTSSDGRVKVVFSESAEKPKNSYTLNIEETGAPNYYDLIDGTEVLGVTTDLTLSVDVEGLTNTYTKNFTYEVQEAVDGYSWQKKDDDWVLIVADQALADELVIEKTFDGITPEAFEDNSQIEFNITGPDGFDEMTVGIGDDECEMAENNESKLICTIDGSEVFLPVGEYTVTESNAGITNFDYTSPSSSSTKEVGLGESATFELKNIYTSVKTASLKVKKVWEDGEDRDGLRPDKLEVTLLADGEAYGDPCELKDDDWECEWKNLPLVNENAEAITYTASEESLDGYESDGGVMDEENGVFVITNTHEPAKITLTIIKRWDTSAGTLPTVTPGFVEVLLTNDKNDEVKTVHLEGDDYAEWNNTFDVYKNEDGEEITYSIAEKKIGNDAFDEGETTLYIYNGDVLEGKWVAEVSGFEVMNTWTPAKSTYELSGDDTFKIVKVDEDGDALSDVVFAINDEEETTDSNGEIEIKVPVAINDVNETFEYEISEARADGYDRVEGSATVTVTCTSELKVDEKNNTNKYIKTCEFEKEGDNAFVWTASDLSLTVTNVRSLADSLTIVKNFSGVDAEALNGLTFVIEGPEDFGKNGRMELVFGEDCVVDGSMAICEVEGKVPTGEYTVTEDNAEIDNYTLSVTGDGESLEAEKGTDVVFEITNEYEIIDPCLEGGCGGDDTTPPVVIETPETGHLIRGENGNAGEAMWMNNMVGGGVALLAGAMIIAFTSRRKETGLTK